MDFVDVLDGAGVPCMSVLCAKLVYSVEHQVPHLGKVGSV